MRRWRTAAIFGAFFVLSVVATWPLARDLRTAVAADGADPVLNASILLWNARTVPLIGEWWNPPHYYPSNGVVAFTESLVGISPLASPTYWLTGNAVLAYNLPLLLTWPLSALGAYLLVRFLTGREDAAILGGLSFGFSPYRAVGIAHIQTLATFGVAFFLFGMHGFLKSRRWPWLAMVGIAWLQQSFANGYYTLYGGLLIGFWLLYFCTTRDTWKPGLMLIATLAVFSLPLAPMLIGFRAIHEQYALHRSYFEIQYFSALTHSWFETDNAVWLWHRVFPPGKDNMFPGVTAVAITITAAIWLPFRETSLAPSRSRIRGWLAVGAILGAIAVAINLWFGRIDTSIAGIPVKMTDVSRGLLILLGCGIPLVWLTPTTRQALNRRSPLVFYVTATLVFALLSCGPELRAGNDVIWKPAPYGWLMALPGFNEVRVPTQLKMIVILCLSVAGGLAYDAMRPVRARVAAVAFGVAAVAFVLDGWMTHVRMVPPPAEWTVVEPPDRREPILELPMGGGDYDATFRAATHRRRVFNGVSGYDPPHYFALKEGLAAHDPAVLHALASLGSFDIVVNGDNDPGGVEREYAASAPGAVSVASDGRRALFRVPAVAPERALGEAWPIASVSVAHHPEWKALMFDGKRETGWADLPPDPDAWVVVDLGGVRDVAGVTEDIGEYPADFPRRLVIDTSEDGSQWQSAWQGPTFAQAVLGFVRESKRASLRFSFDTHRARYIRLRQTERPTNWRIQELQIHAPTNH